MVGNISLSGFSGLDTEDIIRQLLKIEEIGIKRLEARKTNYEATNEIWGKVNTKLLSLRTSSEALLDRFNWNAVKADVADPSILSASTVAGAVPGTYTFNVQEVATNAYIEGGEVVRHANSPATEPLDIHNTLLMDALVGFTSTSYPYGNPLKDTTGSFTIRVREEGSNNEVSSAVINWDGNTDTVAEIINRVNRSTAGVTMFYDEWYDVDDSEYKGKFVVTANKQGSYKIEILASDETVSPNTSQRRLARAVFKIGDRHAGSSTWQSKESGSNAIATLNGVEINPVGNTYTVNGVTVNFQETGTTTVNVREDSEKILENVRSFVKQYNQLQDYLDEVAGTDIGNRGPLAGNFLIQNLKSRLSTMIMSQYNWGTGSENTQLANQIGLSFGDFRTAEQNHLKLDESKFLAAFENNAQGVQNFFGYSRNGDPSSGLKDAGLAFDIREYLRPLTQYRGLIFNERSSLDNLVKSIDERTERELLRIERREEQLRRQFAAMEQALQMLNSQSSYFESQLAQLNR